MSVESIDRPFINYCTRPIITTSGTGFARAKGRARQERGEERERGTGNKSGHTEVIA